MQKPDVDQIDGLSPAISIEQKTTSRNPRSTVGTVTEIYDYMRLLWARVGVPYSPATGLPIESQTVTQMVDRMLALPEGTRLYLLAPVVRGRKGEYRKELAEFAKKGYQRVKIDGAFYEIADAPALDKKFKHDIDVVVDRIVVRPDIATRLADSLETALKLADGIAVAEFADTTSPHLRLRGRSERAVGGGAAPRRNRTTPTPNPRHKERSRKRNSRQPPPLTRTASSSRKNSPARCPASPSRRSSRGCSRSTTRSAPARPATASASSADRPRAGRAGQGTHLAPRRHRAVGEIDLALLPADAARPGQPLRLHPRRQWKDLPKKAQDAILYGTGENEIRFSYDDGLRAYETKAVRGRDPQPRAPLARDRQRLGARGDRPLLHRHALRSPATATG